MCVSPPPGFTQYQLSALIATQKKKKNQVILKTKRPPCYGQPVQKLEILEITTFNAASNCLTFALSMYFE